MNSIITLLLVPLAFLPNGFAFLPAPSQMTTRNNLWGISPCRVESRFFAAGSDDESVNIIIAGAPASGKGTQCEVIKEAFGVVHLSTGDMLRAAVEHKLKWESWPKISWTVESSFRTRSSLAL